MARPQKDTSWDNVAGWYDKHVTEASDHHKDLIIPEALRILGVKRGQKILDVGCGQGVLCRELSEKGALITGIDSSKKLIDIAQKRSRNDPNISYIVSNAAKMDKLSDGSFDSLVSVLAVQNMDPLQDIAKESARVLNKGGRLLWVLNHPCFRIPRQSGWGFDDKRKLQYRRIDRYLSELKIPIQMHPGAAPDIHTWTFHRPLSVYFHALNSLGMAIDCLEEWVSKRESRPGERAKAENSARKEIPMFLAISAIKL